MARALIAVFLLAAANPQWRAWLLWPEPTLATLGPVDFCRRSRSAPALFALGVAPRSSASADGWWPVSVPPQRHLKHALEDP
jgi:hypothetical protein